ncbi:hypothetical protein AMECASPLE_038018, partial [Ameca splendens]
EDSWLEWQGVFSRTCRSIDTEKQELESRKLSQSDQICKAGQETRLEQALGNAENCRTQSGYHTGRDNGLTPSSRFLLLKGPDDWTQKHLLQLHLQVSPCRWRETQNKTLKPCT